MTPFALLTIAAACGILIVAILKLALSWVRRTADIMTDEVPG